MTSHHSAARQNTHGAKYTGISWLMIYTCMSGPSEMTLLICEINVANTTMPRAMVMRAMEVSARLSGDDEPPIEMSAVIPQ